MNDKPIIVNGEPVFGTGPERPTEPPCDDSLCKWCGVHIRQWTDRYVDDAGGELCRDGGQEQFPRRHELAAPVPDSLCPPNSEPQPAPTTDRGEFRILLRSLVRDALFRGKLDETRLEFQQPLQQYERVEAELVRARTCAEETGPKLCPDCDFPYVPISNGPIANGFICAWCDMCRDLAALEAALARARKCAAETAKTPITREDILGAEDGSELLVLLKRARPSLGAFSVREDIDAAIEKAEANPSKLRNLALIAFDERIGLIRALEERK